MWSLLLGPPLSVVLILFWLWEFHRREARQAWNNGYCRACGMPWSLYYGGRVRQYRCGRGHVISIKPRVDRLTSELRPSRLRP